MRASTVPTYKQDAHQRRAIKYKVPKRYVIYDSKITRFGGKPGHSKTPACQPDRKEGQDPFDARKPSPCEAVPGSMENPRSEQHDEQLRVQRKTRIEEELMEMNTVGSSGEAEKGGRSGGSLKEEDDKCAAAEGATTNQSAAAELRFEGILQAIDEIREDEDAGRLQGNAGNVQAFKSHIPPDIGPVTKLNNRPSSLTPPPCAPNFTPGLAKPARNHPPRTMAYADGQRLVGSSDKIEGESSSSQPAAKPHKAPDTLEMHWEDSSAEHTIPDSESSFPVACHGHTRLGSVFFYKSDDFVSGKQGYMTTPGSPDPKSEQEGDSASALGAAGKQARETAAALGQDVTKGLNEFGRRGEEVAQERAAVVEEVGVPRGGRLWEVMETAGGRSAILGLMAAVVSEVLTKQSVLSQLVGRYEGFQLVEAPRALSLQATAGVVAVMVLLSGLEALFSGKPPPLLRILGQGPKAQLWLGRLAMLLFLGLVGYEALHSNRPLLGSFFYLLP